MQHRWSALAAMALGLQWAGCGQSAQDDLSTSASPPDLGSGGTPGKSADAATATGGSDSLGGSTGEGGGLPCALCSIYQYCDGDDLVEQLNNDTYCDPVVTHCELGCLTFNSGAACAIQCGGQVCPPPPSDTAPHALCCTSDARCGVSGVYAGDPECVGAEPSAPVDESCPKWGSDPGCCRADGTCGVSDPAPGAGCVAGAELGLETMYCDGGPADAGAAPADAGASLDAAPNPDPS